MIRLLTGLPRPNGIGEYVAQLATLGPAMEVYYHRPMSATEFEATPPRRPGALTLARDLVALRRQPPEAIARTHVTWEGLGPVYGARTRLITVHHVLPERLPWPSEPRAARARWVYAAARRGHRRAVALGTRTVVPSEGVGDDLVANYGADPARIDVVPHFIDGTFFRPMAQAAARTALGLPTSGPLLLHIGTDDRRKNVAGLLAMFRRFRREHPGATLVQIGRSPAVESTLARGPDPSLVYRPQVPHGERPRWYAAADVVVLPTFLEGFGRAALESLACDRPVVCSNLRVFRDELGPHFHPADPSDPASWPPAIDQVLGSAARDPSRPEWVAQRFSRAAFAMGYARIYGELGWSWDPYGRSTRAMAT